MTAEMASGKSGLWEKGFRLSEVVVRPADGTVETESGTTTLSLKAMEVLACLAEEAPGAVSRQQLLDRVWPDVFVTEAVLTTAVWELRRTLGETAGDPKFVQTLRGRGYRLLVEPEVATHAPTPSPVAPEVDRRRIAAAMLCVAVAGSALWVAAGKRTASDPVSDPAIEPPSELARIALSKGHEMRRLRDDEEALSWFRMSAELDPEYPPALVAVSAASLQHGERSTESVEEARSNAERAVELAPDWDQSHLAVARVDATMGGDLGEIESRVRRALEANPQSVHALVRLSWVQAAQGRFEEGREAALRVLDLAPRSTEAMSYAVEALYLNRGYEIAGKRVEGWPHKRTSEYRVARVVRALSLSALGRDQQVSAVLASLDRAPSSRVGDVGYLYASVGDVDRANRMLERLASAPGNDAGQAKVYLGLGDRERAIRHLERAISEGQLPYLRICSEPIFESVLGDPRIWLPLAERLSAGAEPPFGRSRSERGGG